METNQRQNIHLVAVCLLFALSLVAIAQDKSIEASENDPFAKSHGKSQVAIKEFRTTLDAQADPLSRLLISIKKVIEINMILARPENLGDMNPTYVGPGGRIYGLGEVPGEKEEQKKYIDFIKQNNEKLENTSIATDLKKGILDLMRKDIPQTPISYQPRFESIIEALKQ